MRAVPEGVDPAYARMLGPTDWPFKAENSKGCVFLMTNPEPRGKGRPEAIAQVRNMSGKAWSTVALEYVLLDKAGNIGDSDSVMLTDLGNGDIRAVDFTFRNLPPGFQAGMGRLDIKFCHD
jgi:hypothetical protein